MLRFRRVAMAMSLLGAGMVLGQATDWVPSARGEVRDRSTTKSFQTGGQMSVPILREISATLQQMDGRLARLEIVAKQMQPAGAGRNP